MKVRRILFSVIIVLLFVNAAFAFPHDPNPSQIDGTWTALGTVGSPSATNLFPGSYSRTFASNTTISMRLHNFMVKEFAANAGPGGPNDMKIWNTPSFGEEQMRQQNAAWAYKLANPTSSVPASVGVSMYTTHDELISFIEAMPRTNLTVEYLGEIPRGFPFPFLIFSHPDNTTDRSPAGLKATGLPLVWIQGNIHGGEWSGGEGALSAAYDLAIGRYDNLLKTTNVIVVPRVCADGGKVPRRETHDLVALQWTPNPEARDLNRDNVLLDQHVTRSMRKMYIAYGPHFAVDNHERNQEQINSSATTFFGVRFDWDAGDISAGGTTILQTPKELSYLRYKYMEPDLAKYAEQYSIYMGSYNVEGLDNYSTGLGNAFRAWSGYVPHPDDTAPDGERWPFGVKYGPYSGMGYNPADTGVVSGGYWQNLLSFDPDAPYIFSPEGTYNHRSSRNITSMPGVISQLFENRSYPQNTGSRGMWERRVATGYICMMSTINTAATRGHEIVPILEEMRTRWAQKGKTYDPTDMIPILTIPPLATYWNEKIDKGDGFPYDRYDLSYWGVNIGITGTVSNAQVTDTTGVVRFNQTKSIKAGAHPSGGTTFNMGGQPHHMVMDGSGEGRYQPMKTQVLTQGWNMRERPRPTAYIMVGPYAGEVATRMLIAGIDVKRLAKDTVLNAQAGKYNATPSVNFRDSGGGAWGTNNRNTTLYDVTGKLFEKDSFVVFTSQLMTHLIPMYLELDMPMSAGAGIMLTYMSVERGGASSGTLSSQLVGLEMPIYRYIGDPNEIETYDMDYFLPLINRGAVPRFLSFHTRDEKAEIAEELDLSEVRVNVFDWDVQVHARGGRNPANAAPALKDGKFDIMLPTGKYTKEYLILKNDGTYEKLAPHSAKMIGCNVATVVVEDHGNAPWTVDVNPATGRPLVASSGRALPVALPAWDDLIGVRVVEILAPSSVTPFAVVKKLNGNKNDLTVTVVETYERGIVQFQETFSIANNAADTYAVGDYIVYVDTKGNDQIRECYIKEVLENSGPNAEPIVTPSARVEKLSGNTNNLFITVTVVNPKGAPVVYDAKFSISNNASGTYKVGPYNVFVATKGNDKIEQCYIK